MPRLAFRKVTPDGLSVDIEEYGDMRLLLLTKTMPGTTTRAAQVMGLANHEINTPTVTWYYEYEALPPTTSLTQVTRWLEGRGYQIGVFDQFGNFRQKAA